MQKGMQQGIEQGVEKGLLQSISNVMKNLGMTAEQAMETLGIPHSDWDKYRERLKGVRV